MADKDYFERRAEAEIEAAQGASHAAAVRAHYELAGYYLDLVHNPEARAGAGTGASDGVGACWTQGPQIITASPRA